jgi:hypothetical protein
MGRMGYDPAEAGLKAAALMGWWPEPLKLDVPPGITEQRVFFDAILGGGAQWVDRVRLASSDALDRIAWTTMTTFMPQRDQLEAELGERSQQIELAGHLARRWERRAAKERAKLRSLRRELRSLHTSASWRLTHPLRALRRLFGR